MILAIFRHTNFLSFCYKNAYVALSTLTCGNTTLQKCLCDNVKWNIKFFFLKQRLRRETKDEKFEYCRDYKQNKIQGLKVKTNIFVRKRKEFKLNLFIVSYYFSLT